MDIRQLFHDKLVHTNLTDNHPRLKGFINDKPQEVPAEDGTCSEGSESA